MDRNNIMSEVNLRQDKVNTSPMTARSKTIWLHNTDLDAPYVGGNFNFLYNSGSNEAIITLNAFLKFRENFSSAQKNDFIAVLKEAASYWDRAAKIEIMDANKQYTQSITLRFVVKIVSQKKNSNKVIDVFPSGKRVLPFFPKNTEVVAREVNVHIDIDKKTMAHELGHVWGYPDEYERGGKFIGHVGRKSPLIKDIKALMNLGDEFRGRYFTHIGRAILGKGFSHLDQFMQPVVVNGKVAATATIGRVVLLKKDIKGDPPYPDSREFNPKYTTVQVAQRGDRRTNREVKINHEVSTWPDFNLREYFSPQADPVLFYEPVKINYGETIIGLAAEYGFDPNDWREIWNDPMNAKLVERRKLSTKIRKGDIIHIPIKWRIAQKTLNPSKGSFLLEAKRTGREGGRLDWVQTVYGHNQPLFRGGPFPAFSVDLPTEDDTPFYWTHKEYDNGTVRTEISDRPNRPAPTPQQGTTKWRAVTSLCVVTGKRVSIWNTFVWGIDFEVTGSNKPYPIRPATKDEINGHLNLLRKKSGKSGRSFTSMGWVFVDKN
ncbi:MAG: hypothetical protein SF052_17990 [Bacteroidia bacterium]|nr:hypothetical protein [Bacteroidia bacterium]